MTLRVMLVFVGMLALLLVGIVAVGAMLPKQHVARSSADYKRPPEAVWNAITDVRAFPSWRGDVKSVEPLPAHNGLPAWRERGANGDIPFAVIESQPPTRLVTRITDASLPFGGT